MRINLTKKEIINSLYMQIGFSKKISENLLEDIINVITKNLKKHKIKQIIKKPQQTPTAFAQLFTYAKF